MSDKKIAPNFPDPSSTPRTNRRISVVEFKSGRRVKTVLLAIEKKTQISRNGSAYLALVLGDRSGKISARVWDDAERIGTRFQAGELVLVDAFVESYRGQPQLRINDMQRAPQDQYDPAEFQPASKYDPNEMLASLRVLVEEKVQSEDIRRFLLSVLSRDEITTLLVRTPAAKTNHHAYLAGLLEHTLSMTRLASIIGPHYADYYPGVLDTDLLISGAIMHDIGKLWELNAGISTSYTDVGSLIGHIVIGVELITEITTDLGIDDDALILRLKHMVLSHHGELEWGAVVKPMTPEAQVLHYIDNIDARMNIFADSLKTRHGSWTPYIRSLGRSVYGGAVASDETAADEVDASSATSKSEPTTAPAEPPGEPTIAESPSQDEAFVNFSQPSQSSARVWSLGLDQVRQSTEEPEWLSETPWPAETTGERRKFGAGKEPLADRVAESSDDVARPVEAATVVEPGDLQSSALADPSEVAEETTSGSVDDSQPGDDRALGKAETQHLEPGLQPGAAAPVTGPSSGSLTAATETASSGGTHRDEMPEPIQVGSVPDPVLESLTLDPFDISPGDSPTVVQSREASQQVAGRLDPARDARTQSEVDGAAPFDVDGPALVLKRPEQNGDASSAVVESASLKGSESTLDGQDASAAADDVDRLTLDMFRD